MIIPVFTVPIPAGRIKINYPAVSCPHTRHSLHVDAAHGKIIKAVRLEKGPPCISHRPAIDIVGLTQGFAAQSFHLVLSSRISLRQSRRSSPHRDTVKTHANNGQISGAGACFPTCAKKQVTSFFPPSFAIRISYPRLFFNLGTHLHLQESAWIPAFTPAPEKPVQAGGSKSSQRSKGASPK